MAQAVAFDGVDDQMVYGSPPELTGALSMLIVCRILVTADDTWLSLIENETSGATGRSSIGRRGGSGEFYFSNELGISSVTVITDPDGWVILCATKASGSAAPQMHRIIIGGARTTAAGGTALGNDSAYAAGNARIGGNDDFANIAVACAATWAGTVLTTTQLDGINTAKTSQSILDLSPSWMVDASDGLVLDQVGSADRTSVVGTSAAANDPTGWVYLGGAAVYVPRHPAHDHGSVTIF